MQGEFTLSKISYYIGILIVVLSHVYMLFDINVDANMLNTHAMINLGAAALIIYGWVENVMYVQGSVSVAAPPASKSSGKYKEDVGGFGY